MMKETNVVAGVALLDPITFLTYHAALAYSNENALKVIGANDV
jgi:hypothetical protein